ncbi:MAG: hypothetical protein HY863_10270 [Chloroflexi bacterium]|nr:hypothetical protein [Chloroflexota bacterium]
MNKPIIIQSPDKKRRAALTILGKTQSGHDYYSLSIEGISVSLENRVFGRECMWSHDSRFLSIQEWKENDKITGPKAYLLLVFDLLTKRECIVAEVEGAKSQIIPEGFIGESLMYTVIHDGQFGTTRNFESKFQYLTGWQTLK